jgi:hypothetical protein
MGRHYWLFARWRVAWMAVDIVHLFPLRTAVIVYLFRRVRFRRLVFHL